MAQRRCAGCMSVTERLVCEHCGWPGDRNNEPHQLPVGTVLRGQYMVGRVLGQGGFGITYLGWDAYLEAPVAIKEYFPSYMVGRDHTVTRNVRCYTAQLRDQYQTSKARFLREARILARFEDEPAIVHIRSCFEENDTAYIIMEYLRGETLAARIARNGPMGVQELLDLLTPVMEALEDIHRANMVHRDISPDNIMIGPDGKAKLLDFGAARDSSNGNTTENVVKHGFAPFEQYQNKGELGAWTDVYALCATIWYCLTGTVPVEALTRVTEPEVMRWDTVPGLTSGQRQALEKGMTVRHRERTQSVRELMDGLVVRKTQTSDQLREALRQQVWEELRRELRPRIEESLRQELRPQVEEALRRELRPQQEKSTSVQIKEQNKDTKSSVPQEKRSAAHSKNRISLAWKWLLALVVLLALLGAVFAVTAKDGWVKEGSRYYHYDWPGIKLTDGWYQENGIYYYFDGQGRMVTDFYVVDGQTYYFGNKDGRMRTGWQEIDGEIYYFGESDGRMRTGEQWILNERFRFSDDGVLIYWSGEQRPVAENR